MRRSSPELLERALTHRSYAYENGGLPTNERLEFLGDSVLGLVVTDTLYRTHPDLPEGQLAKLRAAVVNMRALADVGRGRSTSGAFVRLGRGEETTGGRDKSSILADTVEAVIGAVYLDRGLEAAAGARAPAVRPAIERPPASAPGLDWKTSLQELTAASASASPSTSSTESGPDHEKTFAADVRVGRRGLRLGHAAAARRKPSRRPPRRLDRAARASTPRRGRRVDAPATPPDGERRDPRSAVPELPEVEVVRRGLERWVAGRTVAAVEVLHPRAVRRHVAGAADLAAGCGPARRARLAGAASTSGCRSDARAHGRPSSATSG